MRLQTKIEKFNKLNLIKQLKRIEARWEGRDVVTLIGGKESQRWTPKNKDYTIIDLSEVAKEFVGKVSKHIEIEGMHFRAYGGVQELKLFGESFDFLGEKYQKMACLLSSTDGTRNLKANFGLFRELCQNGLMCREAGDEYNVRHLLSKQKDFIFAEDIGSIFEETKKVIEAMKTKETSLQKIKSGLIGAKGQNSSRFIKFARKLSNSKTDKIKDLTRTQINILKSDKNILDKHKDFDIKINGYTALQCYGELFKKHDSGVIAKETTRILELI
jgi:hypothetical protein